MAEEKQAGSKKLVSVISKVILGLVLLVLGIWAVVVWWEDLISVVKGCIGGFLILAGLITLAIAKD
jgi:hypothetical protein